MRTYRAGAAIAGALVLFAPSAQAMDTTGRVGVGADAAFTGGPAAHITWWAAEAFAIQGSFGLAISDAGGGADTALLIGGGILAKMVDTERVNLEFQLTSAFALGDTDLVRLEPGLRPELFVTDDFSLHATVGVAVNIVGNDGFGGMGDGVYLQFGTGGLVSSAGFTFYF